MKRYFWVILLLHVTWNAFANTNDEIENYREEGLSQVAHVTGKRIDTLKTRSLQTQLEYQTLIKQFIAEGKNSIPIKQQPQRAHGAVLFVSFSMPEDLLFALADEAAQFKIPVVINGLVNDDFKKTIEAFAHYHAKAKKKHLNFKGVSIDPIWFEQFHISAVPALVVTERPENCEPQALCANQTFDVVYGNASLKKSLELIVKKGESSSLLAKHILENRHV
ncbi:type-F conjugative transfer system pilin assembly protein TrbC [Legionella septentrionalis]|uniref:type-F conjugative transfer system pilin assembly protein TrbC n=1 Tax=Legionella septentrionalis TaxID=2498109 RepID=UPI000F8D0245|nr:type-F conjugative transfer system pilin assembly protein TrbC [Legionella septentrionalis]RUQ96656.1 type-F conjugative transfer system pilin assembly protein TrbC [Legionella septentrionalis]